MTGRNRNLEPQFGDPVPYKALVIYGAERVYTADGKEDVASARAYLGSNDAIAAESKITMPDGSEPRIISVERYSDTKGPAHTVLVLGKQILSRS